MIESRGISQVKASTIVIFSKLPGKPATLKRQDKRQLLKGDTSCLDVKFTWSCFCVVHGLLVRPQEHILSRMCWVSDHPFMGRGCRNEEHLEAGSTHTI